MRRLFFFSCLFCSIHLVGFNISNHNQLLLVLIDDWGYDQGKLWRFEKSGNNNPWQLIDGEVKVKIGKKGLAWGRGLHPHKNFSGPIKNEADDHSPAGIFAIGPVLGFKEKSEINTLQMPYIHITSSIIAVDDSNSPFYNQIIDTNYISPNWGSSMQLKEHSFLQWGAVIEFNSHPARPREGSCIFLCLDNDEFNEQRMTSSCLQEKDLLNILYWLNQSAKPIIVQLTVQDYQKFKNEWGLPEVEWKK